MSRKGKGARLCQGSQARARAGSMTRRKKFGKIRGHLAKIGYELVPEGVVWGTCHRCLTVRGFSCLLITPRLDRRASGPQ